MILRHACLTERMTKPTNDQWTSWKKKYFNSASVLVCSSTLCDPLNRERKVELTVYQLDVVSSIQLISLFVFVCACVITFRFDLGHGLPPPQKKLARRSSSFDKIRPVIRSPRRVINHSEVLMVKERTRVMTCQQETISSEETSVVGQSIEVQQCKSIYVIPLQVFYINKKLILILC